jgi:UDP:flavonoid glycosyltransferase YjiC (YdhE family)
MKIVVACYGSRGAITPNAAVARELLRRGHEVRMAVPPNQLGFVESLGLNGVAYGPDMQAKMVELRNLKDSRDPRRIQNLLRSRREFWEGYAHGWQQVSATLTSLADGADLLFTTLSFEQAAANVAEYYDIPLVTLHYFPARVNGHMIPGLPEPLGRNGMTVQEWLNWRLLFRKIEDAQRRELGLPKAAGPAPRRITKRGSLEIQAYEEFCFPGLAAEWAKWKDQRPFVGALTMELPANADDEVASWIAAGTPPMFFGFGSTPVASAAGTLAMIAGACAELGERALVCSGWSDFTNVPHFDHVKVVDTVNYAAIFPACRALVHHGGAGTTAIGLRAGIPTLILWALADQPRWGAAIKRLKVGTARRSSSTTEKSLIADLRTILAPQYLDRARELATRMTKPAESISAAADLVESSAGSKLFG